MKNFCFLFIITWVVLFAWVDASTLKLKMVAKARTMEKRNNLLPEPCYPRPCPGYKYEKPDVVATDLQQQNPDPGLVVAEHYGEGDELDSGDEGEQSPPPVTPNAGLANSVESTSMEPQALTTSVPAANPDGTIVNSVINLAPPPPAFFDPSHIHDPNCEHTKSKELMQDFERLKALYMQRQTKEKALKVHEQWIEQAKQALEKVKNLIRDEEGNKKNMNFEIEQMKMKEQQVGREARRHQLESALKEAKTTLKALDQSSSHLETTNRLLTKSQSAIQHRIDQFAEKLKIAKDEVELRLADLDNTNQLKNIALSYQQYEEAGSSPSSSSPSSPSSSSSSKKE